MKFFEVLNNGIYAEGGNRTHMGQPPTVFETVASTFPPLRLRMKDLIASQALSKG